MRIFGSTQLGLLILVCGFTTALFACKTAETWSESASVPDAETEEETSLVPVVCLDGKAIVGDLQDPQLVKAKFHEELQSKAGFPDYYGKNWDALFDMLTDEKFSNLSLLVADYDFLAAGLGSEDAQKLLKVLEDAALREGTLFEYSLLSDEENLNYKCQ